MPTLLLSSESPVFPAEKTERLAWPGDGVSSSKRDPLSSLHTQRGQAGMCLSMRIHLEVYHRKVSPLPVCPPRREPPPGRALLFWKRAHPSPNLKFNVENTEAVNSEGSQRVPGGLGCVAHRQTLQRTGPAFTYVEVGQGGGPASCCGSGGQPRSRF